MTAGQLAVTTICGVWLSAIPGQSTGGGDNHLAARMVAAPAIARISARPHLVYELQLTNSGSAAVTLTQVDVRRGDAVIHSYAAKELLNSLSTQPATGTGNFSRLEAGGQAIFYAWLPLPLGDIRTTRSYSDGEDVQRLGSFLSFAALSAPWVSTAGDEPARRSGEMPAPLTVVRF